MKKTLICCGLLCMALLLFCASALAADPQVTVTDQTVQVEAVSKGNDAAFKVTKSGAESDKLYLIMIQEGSDASANPKPDKDNLYYLNVEAGSAFPLEAYPKDLKADSSYVVYLSDYSATSAGAAKGVAVISTKAATTPGGDNGDSNTNPGGDTPGGSSMKGDLDNDQKRTVDDVMMLIKVVVNNEDATNLLAIADFDNDQKLTVDDVMTLIRMVVNNE